LALANGSDAVQPLAGATRFVFPTAVQEGESYSVRLTAQPTTLDQSCVITDSQGVVGRSDVDSVTVECRPTSWVATTFAAANLPALPGAFMLVSDRNGGWYVGEPYVVHHVLASGAVKTIGPALKDEAGNSAYFSGYITGLAVGAEGSLYLTDWRGHKVWKVVADSVISLVAGSGLDRSIDGMASSAGIPSPRAITIDEQGNLYVAEESRLRKISPLGAVTTLAGSGSSISMDGIGKAAGFGLISGLAVDKSGVVYATDTAFGNIRKITPDGMVSTLAGSTSLGFADGVGIASSFNRPYGIAVDDAGNLFVADGSNKKIRKISDGGRVTTLTPMDANGTVALDSPIAVGVSARGVLLVLSSASGTITRLMAQ
jgi:sugar lactone lactonase YvrE